jgi:hypothetical protein
MQFECVFFFVVLNLLEWYDFDDGGGRAEPNQ